MIKEYYKLVKPGIVYGNVFTTIAGFLFASRWQGPLPLFFTHFLAAVVGVALVIASACVCNNYLDREMDKKMERTKNRALVLGTISIGAALTYAAVLGFVGFFVLYTFANALTAGVALFGFVFYVVVYGWAKRASHFGTQVGSISGAVPIVVGYTAVTNQLDAEAAILFMILLLWQMPHFWAIAVYRLEEYKQAGIPVLPVQKGIRITKMLITVYLVLFIIATMMLSVLGYAGYTYRVVVLAVGIVWLWQSAQGFKITDDSVEANYKLPVGSADAAWARKLFLLSLIVLVVFSVVLAISPLLP